VKIIMLNIRRFCSAGILACTPPFLPAPRILALIALSFAYVQLSLAGAAVPAHARAANKPVRPGAQAVSSDAVLEKAIAARFAKSKISVDHFEVHVQGGIATIEGRTDVIQRKGTATRLARTAGARDVVNRIQLSEDARRKASANLAKGRRRVQVKRGESRSEKR
jgi:hypothetical protein